MKEENQNVKEREMTEEQIDFRALLFKYIIHWPWFVGAVLLCLVGAWFYLHWATPIYNISATVLIKDEKKGGGAGLSSELEDMGLSGLMTSSKNIDNELEVLRSKTLVKEVVNQLGLYITYKDEDEFPAKGLYKTSPVQVSLTPQEAEKLKTSMVVEMTLQPEGSMDVNVTVGEKGYQKHFEKLPAIFPTDEGTLAFFQVADSVTLQDGTVVNLNSASELRYPVQFAGTERKVFLTGEAYFQVAKDKEHPFIVVTGEAEIEALGTSFNVYSYKEENRIETTLVEGAVRFAVADQTVILMPGEQGMVGTDGNLEKKKVDVFPYIAWKEGKFVFRKRSLEEVMHIISRWYNVEAVFQNESLKKVSFSGNLKRYDDFEHIVSMLEMTGGIRFKVEGRKIFITEK